MNNFSNIINEYEGKINELYNLVLQLQNKEDILAERISIYETINPNIQTTFIDFDNNSSNDMRTKEINEVRMVLNDPKDYINKYISANGGTIILVTQSPMYYGLNKYHFAKLDNDDIINLYFDFIGKRWNIMSSIYNIELF